MVKLTYDYTPCRAMNASLPVCYQYTNTPVFIATATEGCLKTNKEWKRLAL